MFHSPVLCTLNQSGYVEINPPANFKVVLNVYSLVKIIYYFAIVIKKTMK